MPFRKIFVSRWSALFWAGGMLWTAFDTVGFGPPAHPLAAKPAPDADADSDATGVTVNAADLDVLANAMKSD